MTPPLPLLAKAGDWCLWFFPRKASESGPEIWQVGWCIVQGPESTKEKSGLGKMHPAEGV